MQLNNLGGRPIIIAPAFERTDSLDRIGHLAADALQVPIVRILDVAEITEDAPLFALAAAAAAPLIIADASRDPRFASDPSVSGALHIRGFLGSALRSCGGRVVGLFCAMDTSGRVFSKTEIGRFEDYKRIAEAGIQLQERLQSESEAQRRLMTIVNNIPALVGYWNRDLRCEFANERYEDLFELLPRQIVGLTLLELMGERAFARLEGHTRSVLEGHEQRFERSHRKPDGTSARIEIRYIPDRHPVLGVRGFFVLAVDVTASHAAHHALEAENARLSSASTTDYLTGLANRRVFSERSEAAWKRFKKNGEVCALILVDLDDFKLINDVHGHVAGDDVLRAVGRLLKGQLRSPRDIAARLGGEEFAILCFGEMDEDLVIQIAERLRRRLDRESIDSGKFVFDFTASFGLAISDGADFGWKDIYTRADSALYAAKAAGKNQVKFGAAAAVNRKRRSKLLRSVPSD